MTNQASAGNSDDVCIIRDFLISDVTPGTDHGAKIDPCGRGILGMTAPVNLLLASLLESAQFHRDVRSASLVTGCREGN